MTTNRKTIGFSLIIIGLILIFLIIYFGFIKKAPTTIETPLTAVPAESGAQLPATPETGTTTPSDKPRNPQTYDITKEDEHQTDAEDLAKIAMAFAERLGSFSSQSDYGNFTDLKIFMTESFQVWADKYVNEQRATAKSEGDYYGITTKALTAVVKGFDANAGTARIIVATERRESNTEINGGEAFRQNIDIDFIRLGEEWLVDAAYWEK